MTSASITNSPGLLQSWVLAGLADVSPSTDEQRATVQQAWRDCVSVALAGATQQSVRWALDHARATSAHGPAAVWGTPLRFDRASAALVNGTAVQALEYDDIAPALAAHLSSVMLPTLSAFGDEIEPGRAIDGIIHGLRVAAAMAEVIGFTAHSRGLQPTHTVGPLAAVLAVSHALGLQPARQDAAIGLAVMGSIGLRANTGTRAKALQSGLAAAAAVRAIELARTGPDVAVSASALDSVLALLGTDEAAIAHVVATPLPEPAYLAVKPFPTSGAAHSSIEVLLDVRSRFADGTIPDRVEVRVPPRVLAAMNFVQPKVADEARWSIRYALGTAWELGRVDIDAFDDDVVRATAGRRDPNWLDIIGDPDFAPRGEQSQVTVWSGSHVERAGVEQRLGYPGRPLGDAVLRAKFDRCLAAAGRSAAADAVWNGLAEAPFDTLSELNN